MPEYNTCAYAIPSIEDFRSTNGQIFCRVNSFCANARRCDGVYVLWDIDLCRTCSKYADRSKVIHIRNETFTAEIFFDRLLDFPVQNLRKLFNLMLSAEWENELAITDTTAYLNASVSSSKKDWSIASIQYQREWRLIEKVPIMKRSGKDISAIRAHNNELTRAVKKAKAKYEHWVKIQTLWNSTKKSREAL